MKQRSGNTRRGLNIIHKGLSGPVRDQATRGECKDQGQVLLLERGRLEVGGRGTGAHIEA